ncbi:terpenoid synthase [Aspergillus californicus]
MPTDQFTSNMLLSLQGQDIRIPNLTKVLPGWTSRLHGDYQAAKNKVLNPWIRRWVDDDQTCFKLQQAEFGIFAAVLCADSSFDRFCTVAKYFAWYYIWDDIFDCGVLEGKPDAAIRYRESSMRYIQHQLLPETECPDLSIYPQQLQKTLQSWEEVGSHIRSVCSRETCAILSEEMLKYMSAVGDANALFVNGKCPSLESYWERRDYAAGVYPGIATIPFVYGVDITRAELSGPEMQKLWRDTSYVTHIANDMLSLRKELKDGQIENLVPVLMLNNGIGANEAMQLSYNLAEENARGMDDAAQTLRDECVEERQAVVVDAFVRGCKDLAGALIHWSYSGGRYFKPSEIDARGEVHFRIEKPVHNEGYSVGFNSSSRSTNLRLGSCIAVLASVVLLIRTVGPQLV